MIINTSDYEDVLSKFFAQNAFGYKSTGFKTILLEDFIRRIRRSQPVQLRKIENALMIWTPADDIDCLVIVCWIPSVQIDSDRKVIRNIIHRGGHVTLSELGVFSGDNVA